MKNVLLRRFNSSCLFASSKSRCIFLSFACWRNWSSYSAFFIAFWWSIFRISSNSFKKCKLLWKYLFDDANSPPWHRVSIAQSPAFARLRQLCTLLVVIFLEVWKFQWPLSTSHLFAAQWPLFGIGQVFLGFIPFSAQLQLISTADSTRYLCNARSK